MNISPAFQRVAFWGILDRPYTRVFRDEGCMDVIGYIAMVLYSSSHSVNRWLMVS